MIEGVNLGVLGIGSGWALVALAVLMIFRGQLRTPREAAAQDRVIEAQVKALAVKDQTISNFQAAIDTSNHLIAAVLEVAQEKQS